MIHTKLLIRRLAYVPWLLAAGLVLGWAGEAAAIDLSLSNDDVREDAGTTEITVTAKASAKVTADTYVTLTIGGASDQPAQQQFNVRYRINLPTVKIAKGADSGTGTITFIPNNDKKRGTDFINHGPGTWTEVAHNDDGFWGSTPQADVQNDDLWIPIVGEAGDTVVNATYLWMRDDDKLSTMATLSLSPASQSKDAGDTDVVVTAQLNGSLSKNTESFTLVFDPDYDRDGDGTFEPGFEGTTDNPADSILTRDAHYDAEPTPAMRIGKRKDNGKATLTIDPKNKAGYIAVTGEVDGENKLTLDGIDLNGDGETGGVWTAGANGLTETMLNVNLDGQDDLGTTGLSESSFGIGIDLDGDGITAETETGQITSGMVIKESSLKFSVDISTKTLRITEDPLAATKGLVPSRKTIREDEGEQTIELTVTLNAKASKDEEVRFTISELPSDPDDTDGTSPRLGERDRDFIVSVEDLTILKGETEGKADLTVIPDNNPGVTGNRQFRISATVGGATSQETITIVDIDTFSEKITLSADPGEVKEDADPDSLGVPVTITAALDGKTLDADTTIRLALRVSGDGAGTAVRDQHYTARVYAVTIDSGMVTGSREITIFPKSDSITADKTIVVMAPDALKNQDEEAISISDATIKLVNVAPAPAPPSEDENMPSFSEEDVAGSDSVIEGVVNSTKLTVSELPAATGGDAPLTYSISTELPPGLTFDPATRTIGGMPTTAGTYDGIVYTVVDKNLDSAALTYSIEIAPEPPETVKVASVTLSPTSVREDGKETRISVTATLAAAAPIAETIEFTIGAPSGGTEAIRDVDYQATLGGKIKVEVGEQEVSTAMRFTPLDNGSQDGNMYLGIHAKASGGSASADLEIADDETNSTSILLSATPNTVGEQDGDVVITITASLDGKTEDADTQVAISIDPAASSSTRDEDYVALFVENNAIVEPIITIPADSVSASVGLRLGIVNDRKDEVNETIALTGSADGLASGSVTIKLTNYKAADAPPPLVFAEDTVKDMATTLGESISAELPAASGGEGTTTYSVSDLPAGLEFDAATRMISGMPEAEGITEVTYTATDGAGTAIMLTFSITVNPMLDFGDLGALFGGINGAAGKANPASEHGDDADLTFVVGEAVNMMLPEVSGGTPPLSYAMAGLPAGLSFDGATRTISGTPTAVGMADVTLMVTDAVGASAPPLAISVAVIHPPLDAPDDLVAQDYKGADGAGDQGGFILLTWDLSEHHDGIDGYRIFRSLPVLNNEMVPWAYVDAVPGVSIGRAVVATLDNVATEWGIAAERGGQTTHGAAKAVLASADGLNQSYELMAETLMASRAAAQAGDGPVFAALLPEAFAYAQGVSPKLNLVSGGVLSSAITITEEAVQAIDDIAPLAVPSLSVVDAPNDAGSRIVLTWTLSPSDQLLQGVVMGAIGPAAVESIAGVHGYGIYRRAVGEDEFAQVGQVAAGITTFVDETALNGVRYTYQVRPFDLDNETASDIEQTAMAVRNSVLDSEGRALYGLFGADNRIGFDDFFIFADNFGLTAEDAGFDPAFDLAPSAEIDFDDFFVFADNFGRSTDAAGKRVPMFAGLNADARMYLDARAALPSVGEDFVLDVSLADFVAVKGYGLQVQYEASKLEFVEARTEQPLGGSDLATPQVLANEAGVLTVAAYGDEVSDGEVTLSLVFRPTTEIENTSIEITGSETYDSAFGFNRLALPAPVQVQTRPAVFALANNYPNPFNPATTIKYALPQAADVELTVYNVLGQPVRTLVAENQSAGRYVVEWDATNDSGHSLSSGMYFYHLEAGGGEFREVKKMLLLK